MRVQAMFHEHVGALVVHYKARPAGAAQRTVLQRSIATQDNHVATQDNHVAPQRSAAGLAFIARPHRSETAANAALVVCDGARRALATAVRTVAHQEVH